MTTLPEDTQSPQPPRYGWLRERRHKLWRDTLGERCLYWLVFSVSIALAPIALALMTSPSGGSLLDRLPRVVANGEFFLIATAIAAPAFGDIMGNRNRTHKLRALVIALAVMTIFFSAALFGQVSAHTQEARDDQDASERNIGIALQKAVNNKQPSGVVTVRLNPVDVGKYLEAHKDDAVSGGGWQWPQPKAVALRSFCLLVAALLAGISGVLIAEAKAEAKHESSI